MKKSELRNIIKEEIIKILKEETEFEAFYNGKKITIKAKDLWDAKQQAIKQLRVPKSKESRIAIMSKTSMKNQDFRFENVDEDYDWSKNINKTDNSIYFKPKNLKKIGWMVINARKNDGRPLYDLYDTDDSQWNATHRMGSGKHSESSPLFYTIPIKIEGNKFKILSDNEKWSRPYSYQKIEKG